MFNGLRSSISYVTILTVLLLTSVSWMPAQSFDLDQKGGIFIRVNERSNVDLVSKKQFTEGETIYVGDRFRPQSPQAISLLDTFTGVTTLTTTTGLPRTFIGDGFTNNSLPTGTTSFQITGVTVYMASTATVSYTNGVAIRIQFFNTHSGTSTPVYSGPTGGVITATLPGPVNTTLNTFTTIPITLTTPVTLTGGSGTNWGFAVNFQGDTGAGLASTDNLTSLLTANTAGTFNAGTITTGTPPVYGFYRNASGGTNFNFIPSDLRTFAGLNAIAAAIIITGDPVGPTAAGVNISGRVLSSAGGRGLTGAVVRLTDQNGATRSVTTGRLGSFAFADVDPGQTYVMSVGSRRFNFTPRVIQVVDNVVDLEIVPE
jgi:hypothetical protein